MATVSRSFRVPEYQPTEADWREWMGFLDNLGRFPSDAEFFAWENGYYPDEPPTLDESAYYEPGEDDDAWWAAQQREDELSLLLSQRDDCLSLPKTLANLDRRVAELREGGVGC